MVWRGVHEVRIVERGLKKGKKRCCDQISWFCTCLVEGFFWWICRIHIYVLSLLKRIIISE